MTKLLPFSVILFLTLGCATSEKPAEVKVQDTTPYYAHLNTTVQKALQFHDPNGLFGKASINCRIRSTRPNDTTVRERMVTMQLLTGTFSMTQERHGEQVTYKIPIPSEVTDSTTIARSHMYQNYFRYMLGGANVLADSSAIIHEQVKDTVFNGIAAKELFVQYAPIGETPNWYFIVDGNSGEMLQSRFIYHEGKENQRGEYILYGPYAEYQGMRLTSQLDWYYLDGKPLATEKVEYLQ